MAAGHAALVHMGHRVRLERVTAILQRQRGATRDAHTGMVATAHGGVHAKFFLNHPLAALHRSRHLRLDAALLVKHAFALRNHHLGALEVGAQGLFQRGLHGLDIVGVVNRAHPLHTNAPHRTLDRVLRAPVLVVGTGRQQILAACSGRVVVVHDHNHAVSLVEHRVANATGQAVVPEAAVAHHRDRALARRYIECSRTGRAQTVAHGGRTQMKRRHSGKQMAADVGRDVVHAQLLLHQGHGREDRALRAADTKPGWTGRDDGRQLRGTQSHRGAGSRGRRHGGRR